MLPNQKIVSRNKNQIEWLIVEVAEDLDLVALTDLSLKRPKRPFTKRISELQESFDKGTMEVVDHTLPPALEMRDELIPDKWLKKRDEANEAIAPIITDRTLRYEYLFGNSSGILLHLVRVTGRSKKYIATTLNRFFAFGGFPNSLLPHYFMCGSNYSLPANYVVLENNRVCLASKPGPRVNYGDEFRGITREDVNNITDFCKSIPSGEKVVARDLYRKYCREYCLVTIKPKQAPNNDIAEPTKMILPRNYRISPRAFIRRVKKTVSKLTFLRKEKGSTSYDRDHAGKPGVAREGLRGPASRYEIDTTVADVYIRYPYSTDSLLSTGRPIIYMVIDTATTMIVGLHVAFDGPNWHGAGQALFNAMTSKVEFCAKYGVPIEEEDWPCHHPCREVTFDRGGENTDAHIESMLRPRIGITAGNLNAYHRGDCKGTVEKAFDVVQTTAIQFEAGKVVKVPRKEDQHASRRSLYTYDEFMKALIKTVIHVNNTKTRVDSHNFEMSRDGVGFTPRAVWNWGIDNAVIRPSISKNKLRFALLPESIATVRDNGVYFQGLYYSSREIVKALWLDKAKNLGRFKVRIRYTDTSTNHIWVIDPDSNQILRLDLTTRSEAYRNQIWADVLHRLEQVKEDLAQLDERRFTDRVMLEMDLKDLEAEAKSRTRKLLKSEAKGIQPGMSDNKALEAAYQKHQESEEITADLEPAEHPSIEPELAEPANEQDLSDPTVISVEA